MSTLTIPPVLPTPREDAVKLHKAFKGLGCNTSKVIQILAHRNAEQRSFIQQEYETTFSELLSKRISSELHGHTKLLLAYLSVPRYEGPELDDAIVQQDAQQLYKAGEKRIGTDEKVFIKIFSERSSAHLAAVSSAYRAAFGNTLEKHNPIHLSHEGNKEGNIWKFFEWPLDHTEMCY
ncbi:Annexin [Sesbania bispinosa]|nr:Annexin [Sesbania bispinosa]